ncbi:MAG: SDR family oxidoreductase [Verrucomicrobia bacterium]|nr:SDR family oxidoreductase [Verrucomicrobiota bacterium]MDA1086528.1 SDR family oxidoreductase [Verrucomicrobiota bacterium]
MSTLLQDQVILVTGSTRGIGRAIAADLLDHGAIVALHGRDESVVRDVAAQLSDNPARTIPLAADLQEPSAGAALVQSVLERCARIDGLVNNAGAGKAAAFRGMHLETWRATQSLNIESALCAMREAYSAMRKQKSGAIVNIASISAHGPGKWMGADYAASKAAMVSITRSLAFESARFGIRVNAVSPGLIESAMTAVLSDAMRDNLQIPMQRLGQPEDVARAVTFLLSDRAAYITGQVLHVDGGLT